MIGVISKKSEVEIVKEFFELFKTPWEFYQNNRSYDVVLSTGQHTWGISSKLLVVYASDKTEFDCRNRILITSQRKGAILEYNGTSLPIYGEVTTFNSAAKPVIKVGGTGEAAGMEIKEKGQKILRVGFNLFQEIYLLLSAGQPTEYAHIPTLEIHISILRNLIVHEGITLVEIAPTPHGYDLIACLTHDVDFAGIRRHKLDHTVLGFVYRALIGSFIDMLGGRISWKKLFQNWKSVALLPCVYLGLVDDFWIQFDRYIEIENDLRSTFFLIPFKNRAGSNSAGQVPKRRATRYDITDIKSEVHRLVLCGCEVGAHGIDAWQDPERGREEFNRISSTTERSDIGVRMHWLYFNDRSPQILEKAGFLYDSTLGYNDVVGYRSGTTQAFRPLGAKKLLELPLHIQDTALFYPQRMDLTEDSAFSLCKQILKNVAVHGGALVINWHHRSLAPERLWDEFYIKLLNLLSERKVWYATAQQGVKWFRKRRAVHFDKLIFSGQHLKVKFSGENDSSLPKLSLRVYNSTLPYAACRESSSKTGDSYIIPVEPHMYN